jgi:hypothetical protein
MKPRAALLLLGFALAACTGALPVPKTGPHIGDDPIVVPTEPPPGKVQVVPPPPAEMKKPVWIDGEYEWNGRRWVWKAGRWEEPQGDYWATAITVRMPDGTLAHFKGQWKKGAAPK